MADQRRRQLSAYTLDRDPALMRRCSNHVVEPDSTCRSAQFDEVEVPDRLRHRTPLLVLGANVKRAASPARERRVVATRPARNSCARKMWDPSFDEGAHSVGDSETIDKDDTAPFPERERPRCAAGAELECPRGLEGRGGCVRLLLARRTGRRRNQQEHQCADRADIDTQAAEVHAQDTCVSALRVPAVNAAECSARSGRGCAGRSGA